MPYYKDTTNEYLTPVSHKPIDFKPIEFLKKPLDREELNAAYLKNGGSIRAQLSIFGFYSKNSVEEIVKKLKARAAANTNPLSASRKTLADFKLA